MAADGLEAAAPDSLVGRGRHVLGLYEAYEARLRQLAAAAGGAEAGALAALADEVRQERQRAAAALERLAGRAHQALGTELDAQARQAIGGDPE